MDQLYPRLRFEGCSPRTNTGPQGTGHSVRISGLEKWRLGGNGLIASSLGNFDAADYRRQLEKPDDDGLPPPLLEVILPCDVEEMK